jgi:MoxR-like ATPases
MTFVVSHKQAKQALQIGMQANTVSFLMGSPAIGKSAIIKQLAEENNLKLIDLRLTQLQPYDLAGLVNPNKDKHSFSYLPLDEFPLEDWDLPENKSGWLLFLDEFNSADKYTAAAAYKLLLDRAVGKYNLHPNVRIICAGNKLTDGAITHKLGTAIQSRVTHLELEINIKEWLEWLDQQTNWHNLIHPFLSFRPELVYNFDPANEVITYSSPRTWEMLSKQLPYLLQLSKEDYVPIIMGIVGESAGSEFCAFLDVFSELPTVQEISQDPLNTPIPSSIGAKWALGVHLAGQVNQSNSGAIVDYLERIPEVDIRVVAYRTLSKTYPQIKTNQKLINSLRSIRQQVAQP